MPPLKPKKPVKLAAGKKTANGKNGKNGRVAVKPQAAARPAPPPQGKVQLSAFDRGIGLLHKRNYREAKEMFEKAAQGPSREITSQALLHVRICERRLSAPAPEPKSADEHYNYAIALLNLRNLDQARRHLTIALEMAPRADHVHYAMGACRALSGDTSGAYDSLRRAIEIQPRNRMAARQDPDFDSVANHHQFIGLLYPE